MKSTTLVLSLFSLHGYCVSSGSDQNGTSLGGKTVLHIGGFFPFPGNPYMAVQQQVAQTALDHVNSLTGLLDGYQLRMRWNWTGVSLKNPDFCSSF